MYGWTFCGRTFCGTVEGRYVEGRLVGRTFCSEGRFVEGRFVVVPKYPLIGSTITRNHRDPSLLIMNDIQKRRHVIVIE